eukprot:766347-Hanusia_phi.AAC.4
MCPSLTRSRRSVPPPPSARAQGNGAAVQQRVYDIPVQALQEVQLMAHGHQVAASARPAELLLAEAENLSRRSAPSEGGKPSQYFADRVNWRIQRQEEEEGKVKAPASTAHPPPREDIKYKSLDGNHLLRAFASDKVLSTVDPDGIPHFRPRAAVHHLPPRPESALANTRPLAYASDQPVGDPAASISAAYVHSPQLHFLPQQQQQQQQQQAGMRVRERVRGKEGKRRVEL